MPGTPKPYTIKAFLFDCDRPQADSHWFDWEFTILGLNTLPRELAARIAPAIGEIAPDTFLLWATKRLPMLRNSLSYHGAEHGVTGFPATTLTGKTYKVRVFAYGTPTIAKPATVYRVVTKLYEHNNPAVLSEWVGEGDDLVAGIGNVRHEVGRYLLAMPDWRVRVFVSRIKSALSHGKTGIMQTFKVGATRYDVAFEVTKVAPNDG